MGLRLAVDLVSSAALQAVAGDDPLGRARGGDLVVAAVAECLGDGDDPAAVLSRFGDSRAAAIDTLLPLARSLCRELLRGLATVAGARDLLHRVRPLLTPAWEDRLAALAVERCLVHSAAPPLWADPAGNPRLDELLPAEGLIAVLFDQPLAVTHELYPLWTDVRVHGLEQRLAGPCRLLGADAAWLDDEGRLTRAMVHDPRADIFLEADTAGPVTPDLVLFLALDAATHRRHSARLQILGIPQVNPYAQVAELADDKWTCFQLWREAGVPTPATFLLPRDIDAATAKAALQRAATASSPTGQWLLQPRHGTESRDVLCVPTAALHDASQDVLHAHARIADGGDDAILRPCVGGVLGGAHGGRHFDLRLHVAAGATGLRAESGYMTVAPVGSPVASVAAGGVVAPIRDLAACGVDGGPWGPDELEGARRAAEAACAALELQLAGVDLRLWREAGVARADVIDVNPRPAGLLHADLLDDPAQAGVSPGLWGHLRGPAAARATTLSVAE